MKPFAVQNMLNQINDVWNRLKLRHPDLEEANISVNTDWGTSAEINIHPTDYNFGMY